VAVRSPVADVVWDRDALVVAESVDTTVELRTSFAVARAEPVRVVVVVPEGDAESVKERVGCCVLPCVREPVLDPVGLRDWMGADVAAIALDDVGDAVDAAVADRDRDPVGDSDGLVVSERDLATDGFSTLVLDHVVVERCVADSDCAAESDFVDNAVLDTVPVSDAWPLLLLGLPDKVCVPLCVLLILEEPVELGDAVSVRDSVCGADPLLALVEERVMEGLGVSESERLSVADSDEPAVVVRVWSPVRDVDGDAEAVLMEELVFAAELVTLLDLVWNTDTESLLVSMGLCVALVEPEGLFEPMVLVARRTEPVSVTVAPGVVDESMDSDGLHDRMSDLVG